MQFIKHLFYCECPACGGFLHFEFYDAENKVNVYKCECCGEEWT